MKKSTPPLLTLFATLALPCLAQAEGPGKLRVYAGSYSSQGGKGIELFELDRSNGRLLDRGLAAEAANPSFFVLSKNGAFLYAVEESKSSAGARGALAAFEVSKDDGKLKLLNRVGGIGAGPCHISLDERGIRIASAAYGDGMVSVVQIAADGSLEALCGSGLVQGSGADPKRQAGPHAHCVRFAPDGSKLFVCDLGLDRILSYDYGQKSGKLKLSSVPWTRTAAGAGPRHLEFHPDGSHAYLINELKPSIVVYALDGNALRELQTLELDLPRNGGKANSGAEILIHPSGRFVYASIRGADLIASFKIASDGTLGSPAFFPSGGETPRCFDISPDGKWLVAANQGSGKLSVFKLEQESGALEFISEQAIPAPVCVKFALPAN